MTDPLVIFWAVMIFSSIVWYACLVFYIGIRAGREIRDMTRTLDVAQAKLPEDPADRTK